MCVHAIVLVRVLGRVLGRVRVSVSVHVSVCAWYECAGSDEACVRESLRVRVNVCVSQCACEKVDCQECFRLRSQAHSCQR